ncbi:MAG: enoyl-CoA hydratase-related protein [Actinomycetota bacterium]
MSYATILTEVVDGVVVITMNRPDRLNAWTHEMGTELRAAIGAANADESVIAIVLTGAGKGFCAGADIEDVFKAQADGDAAAVDDDTAFDDTAFDGADDDFGAGSSEQAAAAPPTEGGADNWIELIRASKPIVAAVNGAAVGVGLTQILPMDAIVAARGAKLSLRFVKMGLVPELASSHFLPMRVGFGAASDLMLTGRMVLAQEAVSIGLVDRLAEPEELLDTAVETARAMGENPQSALAMIKDLLTENMTETSLHEVQKREQRALDAAYATPEHREAIAAFLEKREPDFGAARKGRS